MGLFGGFLGGGGLLGGGGILGGGGGILPGGPSNPAEQVRKVVKTVEALTTDQKTEGKKEGYDDAAQEYEPIYRELEAKYDSLISNIEREKQSFDSRSEVSLAELERLEKERDNLKERLNDKVNTASSSFHVSSSTIFSALNSGSSAFYMSPVFNYSILDGIIEYKEKERREARRKGYLEAKRLYEEKIQKLKNHFEEVKANASRQLKQYAEDMGAILEEIHRVKIQIADLELAMME